MRRHGHGVVVNGGPTILKIDEVGSFYKDPGGRPLKVGYTDTDYRALWHHNVDSYKYLKIHTFCGRVIFGPPMQAINKT